MFMHDKKRLTQTVKHCKPASVVRVETSPACRLNGLARHGRDDGAGIAPAGGIAIAGNRLPQEDGGAHGGERVYAPATWCAEQLPANIRTVAPEEPVWRIRMKHDPEQTRKLIQDWP
jgi:hypothetical protein